jgi:aspartate ammonia-lyase
MHLNGHPRLAKLELTQMLEVEGGDPESCLKILRHEVGHAIDNAYRLRRLAVEVGKIASDLRLAQHGTSRGFGRDRSPRGAAGLQHHARQSQPGAGGDAQHGDVPRAGL